jgi:putative DNA primase/helicase
MGARVYFENIPSGLKKLDQWVVWGVGGDTDKCPYSPTGRGKRARAGDIGTWGSFFQAKLIVECGGAAGLGFEFNNNGVYGIDLDGVLDGGELSAEALEVVQVLDSYTEISPGGKGLHIFVKAGEMFFTDKRKNFIEVYNKERYFTMTGNIFRGLGEIKERPGELKFIYEKYLKRGQGAVAQVTPSAENNGDRFFVETGLKKDAKLLGLWQGGRPNGNESSDDQALFNKLAYWGNANKDIMEEFFFNSPHYNSKSQQHKIKCQRVDYIRGTVEKAIQSLTTTARESNGRYRAQRAGGTVPGFKFISPLSSPGRYTLDDIGMGYLFADTYKNISRYVGEMKSWYCYDGKAWRQDIEGLKVAQQAKALADNIIKSAYGSEIGRDKYIKFAGRVASNSGRKIMLDEAKSVYPVNISDFDKQGHLFNCKNCTLDLRTFTPHPHTPEDFLTKVSNVVYDSGARCGRWENFINEVMDGDAGAGEFLQKALGYSLTGDTSRECFFILYGETTRNGKGTTMETALHLLGDYGRAAQPESIAQKQMQNSSSANEDIARLKGARLVNISEPDKGLRLNTALVKQMTGGDVMTARFLHQNSFEFKPEFKLFINTNHLPKVSDDSIFKSGRIKLIPFTRHFGESEQDKGLKTFFREPGNISGIFNWFLEGLIKLNRDGLEQPGAVSRAVKEYRDDSDTIGLFISDCLASAEGFKVKTKEVYKAYAQWCADCGYNAKNQANLIDELRKKGIVKRDKVLGHIVFGYKLVDDDNPF